MGSISTVLMLINLNCAFLLRIEHKANTFYKHLGATFIFMLRQITSNRRYLWVRGFSCQILELIFVFRGNLTRDIASPRQLKGRGAGTKVGQRGAMQTARATLVL